MDCCRRTPHAAVEIPPTGTVGWMGSMSAPYVCSVFESIGLRKSFDYCPYIVRVNHADSTERTAPPSTYLAMSGKPAMFVRLIRHCVVENKQVSSTRSRQTGTNLSRFAGDSRHRGRRDCPRFHITAGECEFWGAGERAHPAKIFRKNNLGAPRYILCWRHST